MQTDPISGALQRLPLATGPKRYGLNTTSTATSGKLGTAGYRERERRNRRKKAIAERLAKFGVQQGGN